MSGASLVMELEQTLAVVEAAVGRLESVRSMRSAKGKPPLGADARRLATSLREQTERLGRLLDDDGTSGLEAAWRRLGI